MKTILLPVMLILGACVAMDKANSQEIFLLSGKVKSIKYDREIVPQGDDVIIGSWDKVQLDDLKPLIGHFTSRSAEVELTMTSMPTRKAYHDRGMYVLLKPTPDGTLQALTWDYVDSGLCIPRDMAKTYLIEDDLIRLRQAGEVNWKSNCNW